MNHVDTAWQRLRTSRRAALGLAMVGMVGLLGVLAEPLASRAPFLSFGSEGLNFAPAVLHPSSIENASREAVLARFANDHGLFPPVRFGPREVSAAGPLAPSSSEHPLGTDAVGRDLFARTVYGARTALGLSLFAVGLGIALGALLGGLAGYLRGFWNDRLVRLVETVDTFPAIVVVALVRAIEREPSALSLVVAVALVRWAEVARLVREEVARASVEDYVVAARALGASPARVLIRHIAPNVVGPVLVSSVFGVASVMLLEAAVSFLGIGGQLEAASWGETLAEGARNPDALRLILVPGGLLAVTVGGTYLLADAIRDALDPRVVRRRPKDEMERGPLSLLRDPPS